MLNVFLGLLPAWHDLHQQENTQRVANLGSHVTGLGAAKPDDGTSSAAPALTAPRTRRRADNIPTLPNTGQRPTPPKGL